MAAAGGNFGRQFAPGEIFMRWAWDRVVGSTDLPVAVTEPLWPDWSAAYADGDSRRGEKVLRAGLGTVSFRWPWLEQSVDWIGRVVMPEHGWPYLWRTPQRGQLRLPAATLSILAGELGHMCYMARNRADWARVRAHSWRRERTDTVVLDAGPSPAERVIAARFGDRFAAGDAQAWPPYFPGDRSSVRFEVHGGLTFTGRKEIARCRAQLVEPLWPIPPDMPFPALS